MKHKGTPFMILGLLCIAAAVFLFLRNRGIDAAAQESAQSVTAVLAQAIEEIVLHSPLPESTEPPAEEESAPTPMNKPANTVIVDNVAYIGLLEIPSLSLSLPVRAECTDAALQASPCRYTGEAVTEDLVIAGHNYTAHFGKLKDLSLGDNVYFRNADGCLFSYTVSDIEVLSPYDVEDMCAGDWPLTLFTCTYGGQNRVTIRCSINQ